jgi:hypothetical protein
LKPKIVQMDELLQSHDVQLADIVLNPINFGAVGNGVVDDTTAIQNAVNVNAKNLTVNLGGRSFLVGRINVPSNVKIINGKFILKAGIDGIFLTGNKIMLQDLIIDAGTSDKRGAIRLHNSNNVLIKNVDILGNNGGFGIYCNTKATNTKIENVYIPHFSMGILFNDSIIEQGAGFRDLDGVTYTGSIGEGLFIKDSIIGESDKTKGGDAIEINCPDNGFSNIRTINVTINKSVDGGGTGIGIGFANCNNVLVKECTVKYALGSGGIHFEKGYNLKALNNTLHNCKQGITYEALTDCLIEGNSLYQCGQNIFSANSSIISENVIIKNNHIEEATEYGILYTIISI